MRLLLLGLLLATSACTYAPSKDHIAVQNVAIKPDGTRVALVVKFERFRTPTGLAAFPDGGVAQVLDQRADVYVVSLPDRKLMQRHEIKASEFNSVSFSPWLMGWNGELLLIRVSGCPPQRGNECHGPLIRREVFALSPSGEVTHDTSTGTADHLSRVKLGTSELYVQVEPYGASIGTHPNAPSVPFMRFNGQFLEPLPR